MERFRLLAAAGGLALALAAGGADAAVTITANNPGAFAGPNNFLKEIDTAFGGGLDNNYIFVDKPSFDLSLASTITFTGVAAESGYGNKFVVDPLGTMMMMTEPKNNLTGVGADFNTVNNFGQISRVFGAGSLDGLFEFRSGGNATVGSAGSLFMGVFLPKLGQSAGPTANLGSYTRFFLAFDDGAPVDDNHDDFIIRVDVSPVPLPASLVLLLGAVGGLGGLGLAGRRRARA